MLYQRIPEAIDPIAWADQGKTLKGQIELNKFSRLSDQCCHVVEAQLVTFDLAFSRTKGGYPTLVGSASVAIELVCQRCLQPYQQHCLAEFELLLLPESTQNIHDIAAEQDIVMVSGGRICLTTILEDELLLSLPIVPRHADGDANCGMNRKYFENEAKKGETHRPFASLEKYRKSKHD